MATWICILLAYGAIGGARPVIIDGLTKAQCERVRQGWYEHNQKSNRALCIDRGEP